MSERTATTARMAQTKPRLLTEGHASISLSLYPISQCLPSGVGDLHPRDLHLAATADDALNAGGRKLGLHEPGHQLDAEAVRHHQRLTDAIAAAGEQPERATLVGTQARLARGLAARHIGPCWKRRRGIAAQEIPGPFVGRVELGSCCLSSRPTSFALDGGASLCIP